MDLLDSRPGPSRLAATLAAVNLAMVSLPAQAHVKWFSKIVDCQQVPMTPWAVLSSPDFLALYVVAVVAITGVMLVERRLATGGLALGVAGSRKRQLQAAWLLRTGMAVYFVSLILYPSGRHMMITPDLLSDASWVPLLQVVIALCALWRRAQPVAALGMVWLLCAAALRYGWFHMLDYLYFAGIAAFMLADTVRGARMPLALQFAVLRACLAMSLMWVSAEKWMYPNWAYDVLAGELGILTMGLDVVFFVKAAGFVEFCLAFLLMVGRISSQVAASALLAVMAAAIPLVGTLDAVGHTPLLVALAICAVVPVYMDGAGRPPVLAGRAFVVCFAASVPGLLGLYYCAHLLAYPARADYLSPHTTLAAVLTAWLLWSVRDVLARHSRRLT